MELKFINKLESALFKRFNPNLLPASGRLSVNTFIGATMVGFAVIRTKDGEEYTV